jgi:hypothetical protein
LTWVAHRETFLETDFETGASTASVIGLMPLRDNGGPQLVGIVEGLHAQPAPLNDCIGHE